MIRKQLGCYLLAALAPVALAASPVPAANGQAQSTTPQSATAPQTSLGVSPDAQVTAETVISPLTPKVTTSAPVISKSQPHFLQQIELLESSKGAYDAALSEHLVGLGISYQQQGDHERAIGAFKRAMHIHRVHEGLYNLNQVPIFERLIESHIARGEWDEANDRYQHFYWLHKRNFGNSDPRMLPVIDKLSSWHLNAYTMKGGGYYDHLINAHNLYRMAIEIIDESYGESDLRLIQALRGLTVSNYYLATYSAEQASNSVSFSVSSGGGNDQKERLNQYIQNSYYSGKAAIGRMVDVYASNPEASPTAALQAKVELGDWYMLFNRSHSALDEYKQVYSEAGDREEVQQLFVKPVALPAMPLLETKVIDNNAPHSYVVVAFDVSEYGKAYNVEILDAHPEDNNRIKSRVRQSLKFAKFRPRFVDGEPVATEKIHHRYIFPE